MTCSAFAPGVTEVAGMLRIQYKMLGWAWLCSLALICLTPGCLTQTRKEGDDVPQISWQEDDFSWIRGANFVPTYAHNDVEIWDEFDATVVDTELGYAESVGINSVRVFLQIIVYEKDPERFLKRFAEFLALCEKHDIKMMPVLFDSCFGQEPTFGATGWVANPGNIRVSQDAWPGCERYIEDVVGRHVGDPRIALWDIMNEPMVAGEFTAKKKNREKVWRFVRHFCKYVGDIDPTHATTVGVSSVRWLPFIGNERVLSFHSYFGDEDKHRAEVAKAKEMGTEQGKAVIISETGHYATGQSYAMALDVCRREGIGWYVWELMIGVDPFPQVQGVFYPDGTIRSADDLCALLGFRRRTIVDQVFPARRMSDEELDGLLLEAASSPTREWNVEDRMALLHSVSLIERLALRRFQREKPGVTIEELHRKAREGDREDFTRYSQLQSDAASELSARLDKVKQAYALADLTRAFSALDAVIKETAALLGSTRR